MPTHLSLNRHSIESFAADQKVCEQIVSSGVIDKLVSLLSSSYEIKLEAAYCLCHLATHQQSSWATMMLDAEAVKAFVPLLKSHDGEAIHVSLTYFDAMFKILVRVYPCRERSNRCMMLSSDFTPSSGLCRVCL